MVQYWAEKPTDEFWGLTALRIPGPWVAGWACSTGVTALRPALGLWVLQARRCALRFKLLFLALSLPLLHGFSEILCKLPTVLLFPAGHCVGQGCHTGKVSSPVLDKQYLSVHCGLTKTTGESHAQGQNPGRFLHIRRDSLSSLSLWANLNNVNIIWVQRKHGLVLATYTNENYV